MKLTIKELSKIIKEELDQIQEVDPVGPGGAGGGADPLRVDRTCEEIAQGIRPSRMSDKEYERAKARCEDQQMNTAGARAYRKQKEDEKSFARARADRESRLSSRSNKKFANNFVKEMNRKNESFVDRFFSDSYGFSTKVFDSNSREAIDQIRSKNPNIFGAGQYDNPIKMDVIDAAGGLGNFLQKTGAFAYADNGKVYLDPEAYLEAAKMARGISSKKKGFLSKLKSFVGLEEHKLSITSEQLEKIIKEELEAVFSEQDTRADFPSYDAAKSAVEKGQFDVGDTFTFYKSYQDVVKKAIFAGKRRIAVSDMPEDVSVVFYIKGGDVTSMRKKDMGAAAELDKKYRDPRGPVAQGLEPYTSSDNPK